MRQQRYKEYADSLKRQMEEQQYRKKFEKGIMTVEEKKLHSLDLNSYQHGVHNTREKDANQLVNAKFQPYANRLQQ